MKNWDRFLLVCGLFFFAGGTVLLVAALSAKMTANDWSHMKPALVQAYGMGIATIWGSWFLRKRR